MIVVVGATALGFDRYLIDVMSGEAFTARADRTFRFVLLGAAAIRLAVWLSRAREPVGIYDSWYYSEQAYQLTHGKLFRELLVDVPSAEHGPLTSILMAPVSWGTDFVKWQRLVTVVCGIALVWLIGRIGHRLGGRRVGLAAAGIAAITPTLWLSDALVMSESVGMLCVAIVLWLALATEGDGRLRNRLVLGAMIGLAALARSELILLLPAILVWLAACHRRDLRNRLGSVVRWVAPVALAAILVLLPWVSFNLARFENPVLLTTNEAGVLLGANCDDSYSRAGPGAGGWSLGCVVHDPDYFYGEEPSVRSARQRSLAFDYVRDNLDRVPQVVAARVLRTLDLYGLRDMIRGDVGEGRMRWAAWMAVPSFWAIACGAIFGARELARRQRYLVLIPIVLVLLTSIVFYGGHRIRSSAEPSLVLLAAFGLARLDALRRRTA